MKHSHYSKNVSHLSAIDVYRVLSLFGVTDQAIGHAIKKLLCPGQRGAKTKRQDIQEAIDTLERWKAMEDEDLPIKVGHVDPLPVKYPAEAAASIDDESPRMQAIGQNGNGGEHYDEPRDLAEAAIHNGGKPLQLSPQLAVHARNITDEQYEELADRLRDRSLIQFAVMEIARCPRDGNQVRLERVNMVKVTP